MPFSTMPSSIGLATTRWSPTAHLPTPPASQISSALPKKGVDLAKRQWGLFVLAYTYIGNSAIGIEEEKLRLRTLPSTATTSFQYTTWTLFSSGLSKFTPSEKEATCSGMKSESTTQNSSDTKVSNMSRTCNNSLN